MNRSPSPAWRQRENALIWGAPMVIAPALALVPVIISLLLYPAFPSARLLGVALLPVLGGLETAGLSRLSITFGRDFDALTFFAAGLVITLMVIVACSGVLLAIVLTN